MSGPVFLRPRTAQADTDPALHEVPPPVPSWLHRRYGDIFHIRVSPGARTIVVLAEPAHIRETFARQTSQFHTGEINADLRHILGNISLLVTDKLEHHRARKLLMPVFQGAAQQGYQPTMIRLAATEVRSWRAGEAVRTERRMQALTLEIILQVVFGVVDQARLVELRAQVRHLVHADLIGMLGMLFPALRRYRPWRRIAEAQRGLDEFIQREVDERRTTAPADRGTDVFSQLIAAGDADSGLSDIELRDQLITLLLASHETSATALAWALHELAWHPGVLRKAIRAADTGDDEYLAAVFKEAMRLHPVVTGVSRKLTEPFELAGYQLRADITVTPSILLVQADSRHHPDPEEFLLDRFVSQRPQNSTWIPFGGGARRCIGLGFAVLEATVILREILTHYALEPAGTRPERTRQKTLTFAPRRGSTVRLVQREIYGGGGR